MYGLPAYNEKDPSLFMALTYCLFFGIMFGDLGQGLCLALIGLVLARWKGMWLGGIITCCGLSGALFGCVYGSVFGFEDILPGFKIMEETTFAGLGGKAMSCCCAYLLSICLGVFMLLLVMVINILNGIRQKNYEKILFGPNGAAGIVFYAGLLTAAVSTLAFGVNLFTPAYVLPVLILPLVLMLLREPLSHLWPRTPTGGNFQWARCWAPASSSCSRPCLSYLTNTCPSCAGAYAITHVGLMLVIHMLAGLAGGVGGPAGILILVLGNAFVMGFEGLLVGIQVLRLEFHPSSSAATSTAASSCPEKSTMLPLSKRVILRR